MKLSKISPQMYAIFISLTITNFMVLSSSLEILYKVWLSITCFFLCFVGALFETWRLQADEPDYQTLLENIEK